MTLYDTLDLQHLSLIENKIQKEDQHKKSVQKQKKSVRNKKSVQKQKKQIRNKKNEHAKKRMKITTVVSLAITGNQKEIPELET